MRKVPEFKEAYRPVPRGGLVEETRNYRLITPLLGGGVEARRPDRERPIRATGVRGALRFWWRAVRGWQAGGDLGRLLELEKGIFGGVVGEALASPLEVRVEVLDGGKEVWPFFRGERGRVEADPKVAPPYLVFPLRPLGGEDPIPLLEGVRFRLHLRYPKGLREEVEAALWAWETFGG